MNPMILNETRVHAFRECEPTAPVFGSPARLVVLCCTGVVDPCPMNIDYSVKFQVNSNDVVLSRRLSTSKRDAQQLRPSLGRGD